MKNYFLIFLSLLLFMGCSSQNNQKKDPLNVSVLNNVVFDTVQNIPIKNFGTIKPPAILYKTKKDYSKNVPIAMNGAKNVIVSYPAPIDLKRGDELAYPTALIQGYYLDNLGIGPNVVYTSYTYEEYSKLGEVPTIDDLMNHIIDKYPLVEMYKTNEYRNSSNGSAFYDNIISNRFNNCTKIYP